MVTLAGVIAGVLLVVAGAVVLVRSLLQFEARLEREDDLPLEAEFGVVEMKVDRMQSRIEEFPSVIERAHRAFLKLVTYRVQAAIVGESISAAGQFISSVFGSPDKRRTTPARGTTTPETPGN